MTVHDHKWIEFTKLDSYRIHFDQKHLHAHIHRAKQMRDVDTLSTNQLANKSEVPEPVKQTITTNGHKLAYKKYNKINNRLNQT